MILLENRSYYEQKALNDVNDHLGCFLCVENGTHADKLSRSKTI